MKITASQLRKIIAEEVSAAVTESPVFAAASMAGMRGKGGSVAPGKRVKLRGDDVTDYEVTKVSGDSVEVRKVKDTSSKKTVKTSDIKESRRRMSEGHARITEEEMAAWKSGDWGFTAGDAAGGGHDHEEFLHGHESGHPTDDEGYMVKSRMVAMKKLASDICEMLDGEDQLPGWVQDLIATSKNDLQHVYDYLSGDAEMRKHGK